MAANKRLEMIGSAAAGIAHDLNNQFTLILNYLAMSDVEAARTATNRCTALTSALLEHSQDRRPALRPIDPIVFVRNFLAELNLAPEIRIVVNSPAMLPEFDADPLALHRVLTNLISNACAAMKHEGTLRVILRPGTISIEDTGTGIPAQDLAHIFEPFFTTKGAAGTGLGLAIVRDIMRQHGGSVSVHSKTGQGTRFRLRFRLTR